MKNAKIALVAQWDGWCGACAVERPLVLTRSGRLGLRSWLTVPVDETLPLTLTCRLCGSSALVPSEADDPPVLIDLDEHVAEVVPVLAEQPVAATTETPVLSAPVLAAPAAQPAAEAGADADLARARGSLGAALAALVVERTALAERVTLRPSVLPHVPAVAPPVLPLQRTPSADTDSLATLQLLADGLDLLSTSRA